MKSNKMLVVTIITIIWSTFLSAALINNQPMLLTQPDNTTFECLASGDEYFNYLHKDEYTIIQDVQDGYYYYAESIDGEVVPSAYKVGFVNPETVNLQKNVIITKEKYLQKKERFFPENREDVRAPTSGILNNLAVFIRFADQTEFPDPRSVFDDRFNSTETGVESMYSYYREVSYETLTINSFSYPVCELTTNLSYQDSHPRSYYEPYNATTNPGGYTGSNQATQREQQLLADAITYIENEVPTDLDLDGDSDGNVDNVCFIIRGSNGAWADLLWAHRFFLYTQMVYIHGKRVYDYTFQPVSQNDVMTLNHEMFHALGAPDLYHYDDSGANANGPYSSWDIMNGANCHMSSYMKFQYGNWIESIPEITVSGTYALNPLTSSTNNCYKIQSPNNSNQYFILEYRRKTPDTYEWHVPGSGLTISRYNTALTGQGNSNGPPDELYIYRPGGTPNSDGDVNRAHFTSDMGRTEFNDQTDPSAFLANGNPGGIFIHQIGEAGDTISFIFDPQLGFLEGTISVDTGEVDLSQATLTIDDQVISPNSEGFYQFANYEGTYGISVTVDGYSTFYGDVTILPNETVTADFNLVYLEAPTDLSYDIVSNVMTLNWDFSPNDDFIQFKIFRQVLDFPYSLVATTVENSYIETINPALNYSFYIIAEYNNGESSASNEIHIAPVSGENPDVPVLDYRLEQNIPNPFNPITKINYALKDNAHVLLEVFNIKGQKIKTLVNSLKSSGNHTTIWNGTDDQSMSVSSGIYYYKMKTGENVRLRKMLLMK